MENKQTQPELSYAITLEEVSSHEPQQQYQGKETNYAEQKKHRA